MASDSQARDIHGGADRRGKRPGRNHAANRALEIGGVSGSFEGDGWTKGAIEAFVDNMIQTELDADAGDAYPSALPQKGRVKTSTRPAEKSNSNASGGHFQLPHAARPRDLPSGTGAAGPRTPGGRTGGHKYFSDHTSREEVINGIKEGRIFVGCLRINGKRRNDAYVSVAGIPIDVYFDGDRARNRGLEGDVVAIQLRPQGEWQGKNSAGKGCRGTATRFAVASPCDGDDAGPDAEVGDEASDLTPAVSAYSGINVPAVITSSGRAGQMSGGTNTSLTESSLSSSMAGVSLAGGSSDHPVVSAPDDEPALDEGPAAELTQALWQPAVKVSRRDGAGDCEPDGQGGGALPAAGASLRDKSVIPADVRAAVASPAHQLATQEVAAVVTAKQVQPRGSVVAILARAPAKTLIGTLLPTDADADLNAPIPDRHANVRFSPLDQRYPYLIIPRTDIMEEDRGFFSCPAAFATKLFAASIERWPAASRFPFGHLSAGLGEAGEIATETAALLAQAGVDDLPFSDDVMDSLQDFEAQCITVTVPAPSSSIPVADGDGSTSVTAAPTKTVRVWRIPEDELARRRDFRALRIFTCDPTNARDLDDALHVKKLKAGDVACNGAAPGPHDDWYEIGVHIADVSFFVRSGTALDNEAAARCTSTYLVSRVIPMLPALLCEELCSLNPGVDRLAFSCVWTMTGNGELTPHAPWIGRSVIRSVSKLDYATAQRMIDGTITCDMASHPDDSIPADLWEPARRPGAAAAAMQAAAASVGASQASSSIADATHSCLEVWNDVRLMHRIAMARRRRRYAAGALSLTKAKLIFSLDGDGNPIGVGTYPIKDSNRVIEEYMLLAN